MSEKILGIIEVNRPAFARTIRETLFFAPDRVVVAKTSGGFGGMLFGAVGAGIEAGLQHREVKKKEELYSKLSLEDIIKADKNNYAIPNSEITKVELKSRMRLNIRSRKKEHKWYAGGLSRGLILPEEKEKKVRYPEDYENVLRPIFGDKLSVKK